MTNIVTAFFRRVDHIFPSRFTNVGSSVSRISLFDSSWKRSTEKIKWKLTDEGLMITAPGKPVNELVTTIKIKTRRMDGSN